MRTIKAKLITIFMIIMVSIVLSGIVLNSIGLKSYYIYKNKSIFASISEKISNEYVDDEKTKLVFVSQMSNGKLIILRKPIKSISESVLIANQFYMIAGTIVIVIGTICIFIFSKKMTKPIIEMSNIAENISNLDFDKRVNVESKDEIGKLGESINNFITNAIYHVDGKKFY